MCIWREKSLREDEEDKEDEDEGLRSAEDE